MSEYKNEHNNGGSKMETESVSEQALSWEDIDIVKRHPAIFHRDKSILLIVDMQEKLLSAVNRRFELLMKTRLLVEVATILGIPIIITEQYPKGLGPTDRRVKEILPEGTPAFEKTSFSGVGNTEFTEALESFGRRQVMVVGIETHVCVAQTALDLKARGYEVAIPEDVVSSRRKADGQRALLRMESHGITVTTAETLIFELLERAGTDEFKKVLKLIKAASGRGAP